MKALSDITEDMVLYSKKKLAAYLKDAAKYFDMEKDHQLPITAKKDDVGLIWVEKSHIGRDGKLGQSLACAPDRDVNIQLWGSRDVSIDGQQPGWQILARGTTQAGNLELGVPKRQPVSISDMKIAFQWTEATAQSRNSKESIFNQLHEVCSPFS
ncbi:hypothetical protein PG991_005639 [Apiospora marii]|uniref:Uncharacterized protein n=1 Tax=Apiospora marii TaxID=335849 RepID=A0ABR1S9Q2_9PEZI